MPVEDGAGPVFQLDIPGATHAFAVVSFRGRERMSKTYSFDLLLAGPAIEPEVMEEEIVGQVAHLRIAHRAGQDRFIHGVVRRLEAESTSGDREDRHRYRAVIVPVMALLRKKRNSRIFQDQSVPAIVKTVLARAGVPQRYRLGRTYAPRKYCVQHQETDLHFVERLLAEEGLFYFFEQSSDPDGSEVLIVADEAGFCEPLARPSLRFWDSGGLREDEGDVRRFRLRRQVEPGKVTLKEFDFLRPSFDHREQAVATDLSDPLSAALGALPPELSGLAERGISALEDATGLGSARRDLGEAARLARRAERIARGGPAAAARELRREGMRQVRAGAQAALGQAPAEVRGAVSALGSAVPGAAGDVLRDVLEGPIDYLDPEEIEQYDHHGEFEGEHIDKKMARRHLSQHRRKLWVGEGESRASEMSPGHTFELQGAPIDGHNRRYTLFEVEHEGHDSRFSLAGEVRDVYRNTFLCVPAGEAFRPKRPRRTLQQVMETAIVTGPAGQEIHTDAHGRIKVQFHWDRDGHKNEHSSCWIRVMQPWAGAGWGFQFIPRIGMEVMVVFLAGDTDRPMVIGSVYNAEHPPPFPLPANKSKSGIVTESTRGGGGHNELSFEDRKGHEMVHLRAEKDLDIEVMNNETRRVGVDRSEHIRENQYTVIDRNRVESIGGDTTTVIGGSARSTVTLDATHRIERDREVQVSGTERLAVGQKQDVITVGDHTLRVEGNLTTIVGKHDAPRSNVQHTFGATEISSEDRVDIVSEKGIHLRVGRSAIHILGNRVEIHSSKIALFGGGARLVLTGDCLKGVAKERAFLKGKEVDLVAEGAAVELSSGTARVTGADVKLGGPVPNANEDSRYRDPTPTKIEAKDDEGNPLAGQRFVIQLSDGTERAGVLDEDGKAELLIEEEGDAHIVFPDLSDVESA